MFQGSSRRVDWRSWVKMSAIMGMVEMLPGGLSDRVVGGIMFNFCTRGYIGRFTPGAMVVMISGSAGMRKDPASHMPDDEGHGRSKEAARKDVWGPR